MISLLSSHNRAFRRWNNKIEDTVGMRLEPHLLVLLATAFVILIQILLFYSIFSVGSLCQSPLAGANRFKYGKDFDSISPIYVITPTYARAVQRAELTRLSQTLMLVDKVHWIIVEDAPNPSKMVDKFVSRLRSKFEFAAVTLLNEPTPEQFRLRPSDPSWKYPKGVWQRNKALGWLRQHANELDANSVIYFADDDNTYDLEIFEEMRSTNGVAIWPVGLVGGLLVERPIVTRQPGTNSSQVQGFNAKWGPTRKFPVDMAGFALSTRLFLSRPHSTFSSNEPIGHIESHFLSQFVESIDRLEPKASDCSRTLVWHTKTRDPQLYLERKLKKPSDDGMDF